ncbi:hypothetical protein SK128_011306, partial [Halocaridina rubra]
MNSNNRKSPVVNKASILLSREENDVVFKLLGPRCQTLITAVVQVYGTDGPHHNVWRKRYCGVVTFTKDNVRRSYYIQVYDVIGGSRVFEQELYNQFTYSASLPYFHQFEAEEQMIGLNFADDGEANQFNQAIRERLAAKQRKREERKRQSEQQHRLPLHTHEEPHRPSQTSFNSSYVSSKDNKKKNNKKGSKSKSRLSKEQIGMPTDFKHITHVGFDPDKGFSQFNVDDKLEGFFKMVGVSQKQLSDDRTRAFIYDFIEKNGGVEKAVLETQRFSTQPPPLPPPISNSVYPHPPPPLPPTTNSLSPSTPPSFPCRVPSTRIAPPPPPRTNLHHAPPPPPPNSAPPPPPLNSRAPMPPPPTQIMAGQKKSPLPPPPPSASIPPPPPPTSTIPTLAHSTTSRAAPPPPPTMAHNNAPRPPPPPPSGAPAPPAAPKPPGPPMTDARSALMDQIRSGGNTLK